MMDLEQIKKQVRDMVRAEDTTDNARWQAVQLVGKRWPNTILLRMGARM